MNEEKFARTLCRTLSQACDTGPNQPVARRLAAARHLALSKQKQSLAPELVTASSAPSQFRVSTGDKHPRIAWQIVATIGLLLGMWLSFYWHSLDYISTIENVDTALLTDDLPPEALIDKDFLQWLTDDSEED